MSEIYPILFTPVLKDYIWGGRNFEKLGRKLPENGVIAESWEIASHEDGMTVVENGPYSGKPLQEILTLLGVKLVGLKNRWAIEMSLFPLLIKLLDANQKLSVQVHPDDCYARKFENKALGKTEMWVVLDAQPGAAIIFGLSKLTSKEALQDAIEKNNLEPFLNRVPVNAGDHVCVPAGTLHAILEGTMIAEIQQNANITYRVHDWNRKGADGKPRALHVDRALDVIDFSKVGLTITEPEVVRQTETLVCQRLCQNEYFTTDRYFIDKGEQIYGFCDGSTFEIWGLLSGVAEIAGYKLTGVRFILLPADLGRFKVSAAEQAVLLRIYVT